jgi:hypothetical protein
MMKMRGWSRRDWERDYRRREIEPMTGKIIVFLPMLWRRWRNLLDYSRY